MPLSPDDIPDFIDGASPLLRQLDIIHPHTHEPFGFVTYVDFESSTVGLPGHGLHAAHAHEATMPCDFDVVDRATGQVLRRSRRTPQS